MAVAKVVQIFFGLGACTCPVREVAANLGITVERGQRIKVGKLQVPKYKPRSFENDHRWLPWLLVLRPNV
jgi:hypothetical protein